MSVEDNKAKAKMYHDLNPENFDEIFTPDFKGEHWGATHSWNLESHRRTWSNNTAEDVIHEQFGEGESVCTRFTRKMKWQGVDVAVDGMQIKQFRDGKICHVWECFNRQQIEKQTEKE